MNINKRYKMVMLDEDISNIYTGDMLMLLQILRDKNFILTTSCIENAFLYAYSQDNSIAIIFSENMSDKLINIITMEIYDKNIFEKKQMEKYVKYMEIEYKGNKLFVDEDYNLLRLSAQQQKLSLKEIKNDCIIIERDLNYVYARDKFKKIMVEKVAKENEAKYREDRKGKVKD